MSMITTRRDKVLADITVAAPEVQLHTGDPGDNGTVAVAMQADGVTPVARKTATFGPPADAAVGGRQVASDVAVSWGGTEIPAGVAVSHVSVWSGVGDGEMAGPLGATKTTGSDGVTFDAGDITMRVD